MTKYTWRCTETTPIALTPTAWERFWDPPEEIYRNLPGKKYQNPSGKVLGTPLEITCKSLCVSTNGWNVLDFKRPYPETLYLETLKPRAREKVIGKPL